MTTMCTEPCKILDGRWRCVNCNLPRATRWGVVRVRGKSTEGWWCQVCIESILRPLPSTRPAG